MLLDCDFFARIHEALVHLMKMPPDLSLDMLYVLNDSYVDSQRHHYARVVPKWKKWEFRRELLQRCSYPPDHSLLTLYRALERVLEDIDLAVLDGDQTGVYILTCQTLFFIKLRYESENGVYMENMLDLIDAFVSSIREQQTV